MLLQTDLIIESAEHDTDLHYIYYLDAFWINEKRYIKTHRGSLNNLIKDSLNYLVYRALIKHRLDQIGLTKVWEDRLKLTSLSIIRTVRKDASYKSEIENTLYLAESILQENYGDVLLLLFLFKQKLKVKQDSILSLFLRDLSDFLVFDRRILE